MAYDIEHRLVLRVSRLLRVIRIAVMVCITTALLSAAAVAQDTLGAVRLVSIDGITESGKLAAGQRVSFYFEIENQHVQPITLLINGFQIYSDNGAVWYPEFICDTSECVLPDCVACVYGRWIDWDFWYSVFYVPPITVLQAFTTAAGDTGAGIEEVYGRGADSIFFYPTAPFFYPLPVGLSPGDRHLAWSLTLDSISSVSVGDSLCLDTVQRAYAPPGSTGPLWRYTWRWLAMQSDTVSQTLIPTWDGPHRFEIAADCCEEIRGNVNLDSGRLIDISDLSYTVDWMFKSGAAPPCMLEADVDGNGSHDIADLTYLVAYMFKSGPPPAACP